MRKNVSTLSIQEIVDVIKLQKSGIKPEMTLQPAQVKKILTKKPEGLNDILWRYPSMIDWLSELPQENATQQQTNSLLKNHPKDLYAILLRYPKFIASLALSPIEQASIVNIMLLNTDTKSVDISESEFIASFRDANAAVGG